MKRARNLASGQSLVLFVIFLTVLLGVSALGIDYATWLLTDRKLQNIADSAATAGASAFGNRLPQASCGAAPGSASCDLARLQAWTSINDALELGMDTTALANISTSDRFALTAFGGFNFKGYTIWVTTPPPLDAAYTGLGGRLTLNFGIVWARVDVTAPSFFSNVFGIGPSQRHGWATAGTLPTDFALQIFCRTSIDPSCGGSGQAALVIDGQGGIRLIRGDIGSNESLKVTAQGGNGVILESGNMFLVNGVCASSSWNCPQVPAVAGGIADDNPNEIPNTANNKNAFYIPPQPIPHYESPVDGTETDTDCVGASASKPCVPYRPHGSTSPGDWTCSLTDLNNLCGQPCAYLPADPSCVDPATLSPGNVGYGTIRCDARIGGPPSTHLEPWGDGTGANGFNETPNQSNGEDYIVLGYFPDPPGAADPDMAAPNPPVDYVWMNGTLAGSGNPSRQSVTYNLRPPYGVPQSGSTIVRYVAFKTDGSSVLSNDGNEISVQATLLQSGNPVYAEAADAHTLTGTPTEYSFTVPAGQITNYTTLSLKLTFHTTVDNGAKRGAGVSWMEAETPPLDPALPPMIPPGYYRSIVVPDGGCAILDPTGVYSGLHEWQRPGIYRFGGSGSSNQRKILLGAGSYLIGDGVTLVFDADWPASGSNQGIALGTDSALVLNTALTPEAAGSNPCTPYQEFGPYNPSTPLTLLPHSALCASWGIDPDEVVGVRPGGNAWALCDPLDPLFPQCVERAEYDPVPDYRGITFYFTPTAWDGSVIQNRFEMQGTTAGIAFRGVLYAPFDDVKISGANGFNTVGQVLAWTAKFNGGSAFIDLDYPYEFQIGDPYLLEPTVNQ